MVARDCLSVAIFYGLCVLNELFFFFVSELLRWVKLRRPPCCSQPHVNDLPRRPGLVIPRKSSIISQSGDRRGRTSESSFGNKPI
jgi:hypothetical protein